jgi:drug/metabolite transporter (DMT)-like permease
MDSYAATTANKIAKRKFLNEGIKHMLISTLAFAVMNVFIKKLSHLPAMEIVFFRCLVSLVACWYGLRKTNAEWVGHNRLLLILRGTFGTIALYTFFLTLQNVPLANAVTIQYLSPIFTTIIAIFLLGERVQKLQWLFYAVSFCGVLVIKGFDADFPLGYFITGIASAFFSGVAYNLVRSLKESEHPLVIVLHFQFVGVIAGLFFTLFNWKTPHGTDWIYLFLTGVCTQIGQLNLTKALQAEKIAKVSILNYLGILYALIFGWLLFEEIYTLQTLVGIIMVVTGVILSILYNKRRTNIEELEITKG